MRAGLTVSALGHAGLIALAIVGIGMGRPLEPTVVESIAVDLVPVSEFSNIRMGSLDSTVVETETPSAVDTPTPAEIAQPTGNTQEDQAKPADNPDPTPAPTEQTAPAPEPSEPVPAPEPAPTPEPAPPEPVVPTPAPEPEPAPPEPVEATPTLATPDVTPEPTEVAPQPRPRTASLDQKRAEYQKQLEQQKAKEAADKKAAEQKKLDDAKKAAEKKAADEKKRTEQAKADETKLLDEIGNIVNQEESRGATTGQGGQATLGREDGRSATLSNTELGALSDAMKVCFNPPPGASEEGASALLEVKLSQNGMVIGQPRVLSVSGANTGTTTGSAAVRAVLRCGQNGYTMLPQEKYSGPNGWNTVQVTFNANESF